MDHPAYQHSLVHERLRSQFVELGLDLCERIPQSWGECLTNRRASQREILARWTSAIRLVDRIYQHGGLPDTETLIGQMLGSAVVKTIPGTEESAILSEIMNLPGGRASFAVHPKLPFRVKLGRTTGLADARVKTPEGMVRRHLLKGADLARFDALAAWIVVRGQLVDGRWIVPPAVIDHIRSLDYDPVGHLKTASSGTDYDALTFQRVRTFHGVKLGEELKVFTAAQFRVSEVDPCHDGARLRYERRRLLELAAMLGFPSTNLYIVRHASTVANTEGILHGWTCSPMTKEAETEAHWAGNNFAANIGKLPSKIFCSDSPRAVRTCDRFAPPLRASVLQRPQYRERYFGDFEGQRRPVGQEGHAFFGNFGLELPMPGGGESLKTMATRVLSAAMVDVDAHAGRSILFVTHAGPMRALLGGIDGVEPRLWWDLLTPPHLKPILRFVPTGYLTRVLERLNGFQSTSEKPYPMGVKTLRAAA